MADLSLVVGFTWLGEGIELRSFVGRPPRFTTRQLTGSVCFRILPGRSCTGRSDGARLRPCPDGAAATRGTSCDACGAADAFRPCMTCDGFDCPRLSAKMFTYCRQRHHLYLACFGDDTIKVGTTSDPRREQRLIEQGPLAAARVACGPGPVVKQMEHLLSAAGFTETMRRSRKTELMRTVMSERTAAAQVNEAASQLETVLPRHYHELLHEPIFVVQPAVAVKSRAFPVNPLPLEDDRVVEGQIEGAIGHVLFVRDEASLWAVDIGALKGRTIEWDPTGPLKRPAAQLGLF